MPISKKEWERFYDLRTRLFRLIETVDDGYHKSYEGALEVTVRFNNIYEAEQGAASPPYDFLLAVHCYLLIDGRHEEFEGDTFTECLNKFEKAMVRWEKVWEDEVGDDPEC
ncbi:MAG: hypothetical protein IJH79_20675 [Lentisphaeria bacterium]|nr:hypothetical protein [Lentisphaeria bacterium]